MLLARLLRKHTTVFAASLTDLGRTTLIYHRIDIASSGPVRQPMRQVPHEHIPVLKTKVDKLQKAKAVVLLTSPFASPTIPIKMKDGSMRHCIDYRKLNGYKEVCAIISPHRRNHWYPHWFQVILHIRLGHGLPLSKSASWRQSTESVQHALRSFPIYRHDVRTGNCHSNFHATDEDCIFGIGLHNMPRLPRRHRRRSQINRNARSPWHSTRKFRASQPQAKTEQVRIRKVISKHFRACHQR